MLISKKLNSSKTTYQDIIGGKGASCPFKIIVDDVEINPKFIQDPFESEGSKGAACPFNFNGTNCRKKCFSLRFVFLLNKVGMVILHHNHPHF
jgi:hypothetical protein